MPAIITSNMRSYASDQFVSGFSDPSTSMYLFVGRTLPWAVETSPPTPVDCIKDQIDAYREMLSLKKIGAADVSLVIPRNNWTLGQVYTEYDNAIDLFDPTSGRPPFFVITEQLNVYKCLSNNGGAQSMFQPTGTSSSIVTSADGYRWKYMYTVSSADVLKFVTNEWVPVKMLDVDDGSSQWTVQANAIPGTIDRIEIVTAGTQFTEVPTIEVVGDGTGAVATATISGGNIVAITVSNSGSGYTFATINIVGGGINANGAEARAIISPVSGHGSDPVKELGGYFVLVNSKLIYGEGNTFTTTNDYRCVGIVKNPVDVNTNVRATSLAYTQAVTLYFGTVSGTDFVSDEAVLGSVSGATGYVLDWDGTGKVLRVVQTEGTFVPGETVVGADATGVLNQFSGNPVGGGASTLVFNSGASAVNDHYVGYSIKITGGLGIGEIVTVTAYDGLTRTATVSPAWVAVPNDQSTFVASIIDAPGVVKYSGDIIYLENRRPIIRATDQVEDIKIVVEF
jgi:hypothetical protein